MRKRFILITILALIAIIGGVGIGLAWRTSYLDRWLPPSVKERFGRGEKPGEEPGEKPGEQPEEGPTKDWKTYKNEKHGYSFKYPEDCTVVYQPTWGEDGVIAQLKEESKRDFLIAIYIFRTDTPFYNPPLGTDLISWLKEWELLPDDVERLNFEVDGTPAVRGHSFSPETGSQYHVSVIKDDKLFDIDTMDDGSEGAKEFFDLFLSTFKFIE